MRGSIFGICVALAVLLIARVMWLPGERNNDVQRKLTQRSLPEKSLPDGFEAEFDQYHLQTVENFGRAMGFGRHRGGAHVLHADGAVKFVTDSIENAESTKAHTDTKSPYDLWGRLGADQQHDEAFEGLSAVVVDQKAFIESSEPAPKPVLPPPPAIREQTRYHNGLDQLGFARFAPPSGPGAGYPFELTSIDLLSTEMELGYSLKTEEDTRFMMNSVTRELDPFESEAIPRLKTGSQYESMRVGQQLQVVAAIRSSERCNECHRTNTGDLLGAFHYRLTIR